MFATLFGRMAEVMEAHRHNERGASFTEYVVLLAGIVALVVAAMVTLTTYINGKLTLP